MKHISQITQEIHINVLSRDRLLTSHVTSDQFLTEFRVKGDATMPKYKQVLCAYWNFQTNFPIFLIEYQLQTQKLVKAQWKVKPPQNYIVTNLASKTLKDGLGLFGGQLFCSRT